MGNITETQEDKFHHDSEICFCNFHWSSFSKFTFLDCIFFLYNRTRTWALVLISSQLLSDTLVFCDLGKFDLKSGSTNSSAEKNLKWIIKVHLHSNKTYMSHHFNLNYGMRMEKADKLLLTVKTSTINCLTSMIFFPNQPSL